MRSLFIFLFCCVSMIPSMAQYSWSTLQNLSPRFVKSITVGENRYVFQYKDARTPLVTSITCVTPYGSSETQIVHGDGSHTASPVVTIHHSGVVDTLRYRLGRWAFTYSDPLGDAYTDEYLVENTPEGAAKLSCRWRTCVNSVDVETTETHRFKYVRNCLMNVREGRKEVQWKYGGKQSPLCTIDLIQFATVGFVGGTSLYAVPQVLNNLLMNWISGARLPISAVDENARVSFSYKFDERDYVRYIRMRGVSFTKENDFDVKVEVEYMD